MTISYKQTGIHRQVNSGQGRKGKSSINTDTKDVELKTEEIVRAVKGKGRDVRDGVSKIIKERVR